VGCETLNETAQAPGYQPFTTLQIQVLLSQILPFVFSPKCLSNKLEIPIYLKKKRKS
jgi:hypothetical protein